MPKCINYLILCFSTNDQVEVVAHHEMRGPGHSKGSAEDLMVVAVEGRTEAVVATAGSAKGYFVVPEVAVAEQFVRSAKTCP